MAFAAFDVPNPDRKARFLSTFTTRHSIAFFQANGSVSLEIVEQGSATHPVVSPYTPILGAGSQSLEALVNRWSVGRLERRFSDAFGQYVWGDADDGDGASLCVPLLEVSVADLTASERFWIDAIGFEEQMRGVRAGRTWSLLTMAAPLPQWRLSVLLVEADRSTAMPMLDSPGVVCVSFLVTSLSGTDDRLMSMGATDRSGAFELDVRDRRFRIGFFRGPNQELVELLEMVNTK